MILRWINLAIKSKSINDKGASASITFTADKSDTYYCTVPGHRAAGMVGNFEVVEGSLTTATVAGQLPMKNGKPLNLNVETGTLSRLDRYRRCLYQPTYRSGPIAGA